MLPNAQIFVKNSVLVYWQFGIRLHISTHRRSKFDVILTVHRR